TADPYTNWLLGEPNALNDGEDFAIMRPDGTWVDVVFNQGSSAGFIIEFEYDADVYIRDAVYGTGFFAALNQLGIGNFAYQLDNDRPVTEALSSGDSAGESFDIHVTDGTASVSANVDVTVYGNDDFSGDVFLAGDGAFNVNFNSAAFLTSNDL